jgi:hypothetical protein
MRHVLAVALILPCVLGAGAAVHGQISPYTPMTLYAYKSSGPAGSWFTLRAAGDVDADGLQDFAVGDPYASAGLTRNGIVWIRSGRDGTILHQFSGSIANAKLGVYISAAGDIDLDGFADVLVSGEGIDPLSGAPTTARVYSGLTGDSLFDVPAEPVIGFTASALYGGQDIDGDGAPDLVVGSLAAAPAGPFSGAVRVYSGANQQLLHAFDGAATFEYFGRSVAAADINGDGCADVIVGVPGAAMPAGNTGCVRVLSGSDGTLLAVLAAPPTPFSKGTGYLVCAPGDLDNDGTPDVGVVIDGDGSHGYLRVFSGRTGATLLDVGSGSPGNWIEAAEGVGDMNGDGTPDLAVGNLSGDIPDVVRIHSGADGSVLQAYYFGGDVAGLGDVDGDGFLDLGTGGRVISGAPSHWEPWGFSSFGKLLEIHAYATFGAGMPAIIALRFADPGASAWLVIGLQAIQQPFHDATLYASPDVILGTYQASAEGEVRIVGRWPPGVPSGFEILFQFLTGSAQPNQYMHTSALKAVVP